MQKNQTLNFLRDKVGTVERLLSTKKILNEVSFSYFSSPLYIEATDAFRDDTLYLLTLFDDLLNELYFEQQESENKTKSTN